MVLYMAIAQLDNTGCHNLHCTWGCHARIQDLSEGGLTRGPIFLVILAQIWNGGSLGRGMDTMGTKLMGSWARARAETLRSGIRKGLHLSLSQSQFPERVSRAPKRGTVYVHVSWLVWFSVWEWAWSCTISRSFLLSLYHRCSAVGVHCVLVYINFNCASIELHSGRTVDINNSLEHHCLIPWMLSILIVRTPDPTTG